MLVVAAAAAVVVYVIGGLTLQVLPLWTDELLGGGLADRLGQPLPGQGVLGRQQAVVEGLPGAGHGEGVGGGDGLGPRVGLLLAAVGVVELRLFFGVGCSLPGRLVPPLCGQRESRATPPPPPPKGSRVSPPGSAAGVPMEAEEVVPFRLVEAHGGRRDPEDGERERPEREVVRDEWSKKEARRGAPAKDEEGLFLGASLPA